MQESRHVWISGKTSACAAFAKNLPANLLSCGTLECVRKEKFRSRASHFFADDVKQLLTIGSGSSESFRLLEPFRLDFFECCALASDACLDGNSLVCLRTEGVEPTSPLDFCQKLADRRTTSTSFGETQSHESINVGVFLLLFF